MMFSSLKGTVKQDIRQIRKKYRILKIKWFLLFVLPILLIIIAYQTAKQLLKLKIKGLGSSSALNLPEKPNGNSKENPSETPEESPKGDPICPEENPILKAGEASSSVWEQ